MPLLLALGVAAVSTGALSWSAITRDTEKMAGNVVLMGAAAFGGFVLYQSIKSGKLKL